MLRRTRLMLIALAAGMACSTAASAGETVTYTYDRLGRLVKVVRDKSSTATDAQACYKLDKAGNRIKVTVVNVATPPPCP